MRKLEIVESWDGSHLKGPSYGILGKIMNFYQLHIEQLLWNKIFPIREALRHFKPLPCKLIYMITRLENTRE